MVLADEINRASPQTQSALLEAMSDRTVSVDGTSHALPEPFFVVATQNPLEHHGTHPLPESQLDRFLMRLSIGYPDRESEAAVLAEDPSPHTPCPRSRPSSRLEQLLALQAQSERVKLEERLLGYLLDLVEATRLHEGLALGASTRGALALRRAAQAARARGRARLLHSRRCARSRRRRPGPSRHGPRPGRRCPRRGRGAMDRE